MKVALIAHDNKKKQMIELVNKHKDKFIKHQLFGTGTTGKRIMDEIGLPVHCYKSGPLGGDQEIGAKVSRGEIDMIIFLRDPLTAHPHEPDVSALLRLSDIYEIPLATNRKTAEMLIDNL
ncbi:methylglyoxal synthase [Mycoplasmatota bacterium]|nr:methylglyoxal synthase [Mycoplasmatota bacterium]